MKFKIFKFIIKKIYKSKQILNKYFKLNNLFYIESNIRIGS